MGKQRKFSLFERELVPDGLPHPDAGILKRFPARGAKRDEVEATGYRPEAFPGRGTP